MTISPRKAARRAAREAERPPAPFFMFFKGENAAAAAALVVYDLQRLRLPAISAHSSVKEADWLSKKRKKIAASLAD